MDDEYEDEYEDDYGQGELNFDSEEHGAARRSDPRTSHDAAESVKTSHLQSVICDTLAKARTGQTTHEIAAATGIGYQTITPRMPALRDKGLVYWTGEKRTWAGAPGSPPTTRLSMVWQLTSLRDVSPIPCPYCWGPRGVRTKVEGECPHCKNGVIYPSTSEAA